LSIEWNDCTSAYSGERSGEIFNPDTEKGTRTRKKRRKTHLIAVNPCIAGILAGEDINFYIPSNSVFREKIKASHIPGNQPFPQQLNKSRAGNIFTWVLATIGS
jgi:hypothetical protein